MIPLISSTVLLAITAGAASAGTAVSTAAVTQEHLRPQLMDRLVISQQGALVGAAVTRILQTPMGRTLATEFLSEGAAAEVIFEPFADSRIITENGRKVIEGTPAKTRFKKESAQAALNRLYLDADASFVRGDLPRVLAHEIFGHILEGLKARHAGMERVYSLYEDDETNAGAVEWIVMAELGYPQNDLYEYSYLENFGEYHRLIEMSDTAYALTFSLEQMKDPTSILKGRRLRCEHALARFKESVLKLSAAQNFIYHLLSKHKDEQLAGVDIEEERFQWLQALIRRRREKLARMKHRFEKMKDALDKHISFYSSAAGRRFLRGISEALGTDGGRGFFEAAARRLEERRRRLARLVPDPKRPKFSAPSAPPGQVSWKQLRQMYRKDLLGDQELLGKLLLGSLNSGAADADWANLSHWEIERTQY